jgi:hypothetical protein
MALQETPPQPLPPPLRGIETGTFTHYSIVVRLGEIARRTRAENELPENRRAALDDLIEEIPQGAIRPVFEPLAPDAALWAGYIAPHLGKNWLEVPWFFAEAYFYRRILEAAGYFSPGSGEGVDPFRGQKNQAYAQSQSQVHDLAKKVNRSLEGREAQLSETLTHLLQAALWGNQADLSLWPAGGEGQPGHASSERAREHLLVDDSAAVAQHLAALKGQGARVDFLNDNAGFELVTDLCLADFLLSSGLVGQVRFHLKAHPTFVSDTLPADVGEAVRRMGERTDPDTPRLAARLVNHLEGGRLTLGAHAFWTSPLPAWEMPHELREELAASALVIVKGDMHYRRCLGDLHWPFTTPFQDILRYYPSPVACLRTVKSEVACGLSDEQVEELAERDPEWLTNGLWGLIQFRG